MGAGGDNGFVSSFIYFDQKNYVKIKAIVIIFIYLYLFLCNKYAICSQRKKETNILRVACSISHWRETISHIISTIIVEIIAEIQMNSVV